MENFAVDLKKVVNSDKVVQVLKRQIQELESAAAGKVKAVETMRQRLAEIHDEID